MAKGFFGLHFQKNILFERCSCLDNGHYKWVTESQVMEKEWLLKCGKMHKIRKKVS